MLAESFKKVKAWCEDNRSDLVIAGIIFCTGLSGFGLGRLSIDLKPLAPLSVIEPADNSNSPASSANSSSANASGADKRVFASRNGTVYYYSWCSGAKRVKEGNKVWFPDSNMAEQAGLKRAGSCK